MDLGATAETRIAGSRPGAAPDSWVSVVVVAGGPGSFGPTITVEL